MSCCIIQHQCVKDRRKTGFYFWSAACWSWIICWNFVCLLQHLCFAIPASTYADILAIYMRLNSHDSFLFNAWLLAEHLKVISEYCKQSLCVSFLFFLPLIIHKTALLECLFLCPDIATCPLFSSLSQSIQSSRGGADFKHLSVTIRHSVVWHRAVQ